MHKNLKINPDFQNLIAPLTEDESNQLEQNILAQGRCRDTIKIWQNYIIDGHNRYAICQKHKIPYETQQIRLSSKKDAEIWIANNQLGRRNLPKAKRIELAYVKSDLMQSIAKANNEPYHARKSIAKDAGVSEQTVQKYMKIAGSGAAELIERVKKGELKISTAHKTLQMATRTHETLYDDADLKYKNHSACYQNILFGVNRAYNLYKFLDKQALSISDAGNRESIIKRLERQLKIAERVVHKSY